MKLIGLQLNTNNDLKDIYKTEKTNKGSIEIYIDKKDIKIKIISIKSTLTNFKNLMNGINIDWNKNTQNTQNKKLNLIGPDKESLTQELIKNAILCELYNSDTKSYIIAETKRNLLYSIINSRSTSNPQTLIN